MLPPLPPALAALLDLRRRPLPLWPAALALAALLLALGARDPFWSGDYMAEAWPAYHALQAGDLAGFRAHLPGYAAFAGVIGAPAALLAGALGGQETMVFRLTALPGALALAALAVHLAQHARSGGARGWPLALGLVAAGPIAEQALAYGHPEDLLAAAGAVGGVLLARHGRLGLAAALLVVAVGAKQWAVLAILPAALAAPRHPVRLLLLAGGGTVALLGALHLLSPGLTAMAATTGALFHPHQVWWPLGVPATAAFSAAGHGERMGPAWLSPVTHPLIIGLALPLAAAHWLRAKRGARAPRARTRDDALALLALLFLLRCALDPWNLVYYHLPLVLALAAWEVRRGRPYPVLALSVTVAAWLSFVTYAAHGGNGPFLAYFAWVTPLAALLAVELYGTPSPTIWLWLARRRSSSSPTISLPGSTSALRVNAARGRR